MKAKVFISILSIFLLTACSSTPNSDSTPTSDSGDNETPPTQTSGQTIYTMADVEANNTQDNCYTAINNKVYDLTAFIQSHPGGARNITKLCGRDGTTIYSNQHGGQTDPEEQLAELYIGELTK